jgi:hypothetical protein
MTDQTKPETPAGQPLGATGDGDTGVPEFEQGISNRPGDKAEDDPKNPASKPQGTVRDQEKNMESEGQPVQLPADAGDLPASTDDEAEREREAKLTRDGSGF